MNANRKSRGFTLIELMIVISIILILISLAAPIYTQSVRRAREAVLRQDLYTMREQIQNYTMDKLRAPQSLDDLVSAGYMAKIPTDPFTDRTDTWAVDQEDTLLSIDQTQPGITDVHSGATGNGTDGVAYSQY